jgi:hypothetical protein
MFRLTKSMAVLALTAWSPRGQRREKVKSKPINPNSREMNTSPKN